VQHPIVKRVLALLAGLLVSNGLIVLIEGLGHRAYPPPAGLIHDAAAASDPAAQAAFRKAVADYMATAPMGALLFPLLSWGLGAAAGAWVAARLSPDRPLRQASIVGALVMAGTVFNLAGVPHPTWMWLAGPLLVLAGTWLGTRSALRMGRPGRPLED